MTRGTLALLGALGVIAVHAAAACRNDEPTPCKVDTDCPQGDLCREGRCGPVGGDGGAATDAPGGAVEDTTPDPGSSGGGTCLGLYEGCSGDECCAGLSCMGSVCR